MTDDQLTAAGRAWQKHMADGDHAGALAAMREALQPALREQWAAGYKRAARPRIPSPEVTPMTARCKIISDCQSCDFAQYQSGGRYRCTTAKIDLPGIGRPAEPPDWCPLPVYRADMGQSAASGDTFDGLTLDQVKANLSLLKEDDLRGLVVSLLIQQRIAERAFAATQPA